MRRAGLRTLNLLQVQVDGIIPARAGFTRGRGSPARPWRDHPRSRGVYGVRVHAPGRQEGSSPLARGLPEFLRGHESAAGIIPARAGFTLAEMPSPLSARGSSPLARGLHGAVTASDDDLRIIPARAGFTAAATAAGKRSTGSSPLARGLLTAAGADGGLARIIPARAGFTRAHDLLEAGDRDHPRSRGVYRRRGSGGRCGAGSSPLARGLPPPVGPVRGRVRIIPARAGFTTRCQAASS